MYNSQSTMSPKSQFGPINRRVEIEYNILEKDSIIEVLVMTATGFNEGELADHLLIRLQNGESLNVPYTEQNHREYVESYSYNYTQPVYNTQTVTDPGGTDIVTQADGTVKHVHRAASTKVVNSTEQVTRTNQGGKSKLFNNAKAKLNKEDIQKIKSHQIESMKLVLQNANLILKPTRSQSIEIGRYLKQ